MRAAAVPEQPDPLSKFMGFSLEADPSLPPGVMQFVLPKAGGKRRVLATVVNIGDMVDGLAATREALAADLALPSGPTGDVVKTVGYGHDAPSPRPPAPPPPPPIQIEGLHPLCEGCNGKGGYARPGGPGKCQVCNARGAGEALAEPVRAAPVVRTAAPAATGGELPEDAGALLAEARLRGLIDRIIQDRGMAAAMNMFQRAVQDAMRDARASGRSMQGYIG